MVLLAPQTKYQCRGVCLLREPSLSRARFMGSDYHTPTVPLTMNVHLFNGDASADFYTITQIAMDAPSLSLMETHPILRHSH